MPGAGNPQNLNRYAYVNGNPMRYNDPTGHCPAGDGPDRCDRDLMRLQRHKPRWPRGFRPTHHKWTPCTRYTCGGRSGGILGLLGMERTAQWQNPYRGIGPAAGIAGLLGVGIAGWETGRTIGDLVMNAEDAVEPANDKNKIPDYGNYLREKYRGVPDKGPGGLTEKLPPAGSAERGALHDWLPKVKHTEEQLQ